MYRFSTTTILNILTIAIQQIYVNKDILLKKICLLCYLYICRKTISIDIFFVFSPKCFFERLIFKRQ